MRTKRVSRNEHVRNLCEVAAFILKDMPRNAATKFAVRQVLRVAVNKSCPVYNGGDNKRNVKYVSAEAEKSLREKSGKRLEADHAVPISELLELINNWQGVPGTEDLLDLVSKYWVMALITEAEHDALGNELKAEMPPGWDGQDVLARYNHVGIQLREVKDIPDFQTLIGLYVRFHAKPGKEKTN